MLTNAGLAISIENLNGLPNSADPAQDQANLVAKQNKVRIVIVYRSFDLTPLAVLRSYSMDHIWTSCRSFRGGEWFVVAVL